MQQMRGEVHRVICYRVMGAISKKLFSKINMAVSSVLLIIVTKNKTIFTYHVSVAHLISGGQERDKCLLQDTDI